MKLATQVAREVLAMERRIYELEAENEELRGYRVKYMELLNGSVDHGRHMLGGLLALAMEGRINFDPKPVEGGAP